MRIAVGFKAHSGWAALVALGRAGGQFDVIDRRRIDLVEADSVTWAKQPYHSAEGLPAESARRLVARGVEMAHRVAGREVRSLAATACHLKLVTIPEKDLGPRAEESIDLTLATRQLAALGKSIGPPWGKDQKSAALAAMIVLQEHSR